MIFQHQMQQ